MLLNIKQAKKLGMNQTINLKYMNAREYCDKIEKNTPIKTETKKILILVGIVGYVVSFLYAFGIIAPQGVNASHTSENTAFLSRFPDETRVIGCYNDITKQAREESRCTNRGDHNIMLPPKSQIKVWLKYYNEAQIINRLGIVNFESSFTETANNPHAHGYVQTLRSHGISPDINSQLSWMSNREKTYKARYFQGNTGRLDGCGKYWEYNNTVDGFKRGEHGVMSCLYRYHYHSRKGVWYAKRGMEATLYYKWYMFDQRGKNFQEYKNYMNINL